VITSDAFRGKRYAVLGLARSGAATVDALLASGAGVTAWDSDEAKRAQFLPELVSGRGTAGEAGGGGANSTVANAPPPSFGRSPSRSKFGEELTLADPLAIDLTGFDGIVVSPGVPLNRHPIAARARDAGVPVIGDIELFALARPGLPAHKVVGITGTNGKSTTTALITHILQAAGVPALMGGNIGLPILARDPLPAGGVYVLELSSYQIDLTFSLDCDVAVLTNITPDHLDRYDGFEDYVASKARLFALQSPDHVAVVATEDKATKQVAVTLAGAIEVSSMSPAVARQAEWPSLQGPHNAQNAACAIATCRALGLADDAIQLGLRTYPGLAHRMERIAEKDGVLYVNDSKATNATATAPALAAYPLIHWILGGVPKTDDLDDCAPYFDHVKAAYTIGEAGPMFARILKAAGKPVTESTTLAQAVRDAHTAAGPGEVVMLSPACASFDQFRDFEARGDAFRVAVEAL